MHTEAPKHPRRAKTRASAKKAHTAPGTPANASAPSRAARPGRAMRSPRAAEAASATHPPLPESFRNESDPDLRHRLISEAAYALFAQRGYRDGYDVDDWLEAEARIDATLADSEAPMQEEPSEA